METFLRSVLLHFEQRKSISSPLAAPYRNGSLVSLISSMSEQSPAFSLVPEAIKDGVVRERFHLLIQQMNPRVPCCLDRRHETILL
jgi:hypothetical protein